MKLKILGGLLICSLGLHAHAGLLIDPYFGFGQYRSTADFVNDQSETAGLTAFGSKVGYSLILLSAGIDYQILETEDVFEEKTNITNVSAFVGVDLPILFRFWAEFFFNSDVDSNRSGADYNFKDGYGLGVGFTGLPFVSLNLELENLNYDLEVGGNEVDYSVVQTVLSVSLPINL